MLNSENAVKPDTMDRTGWNEIDPAQQGSQVPDSLLTVLLRRRGVMLGIVLTFLLGGMLYTYLRPPHYQATSSILVAIDHPNTVDERSSDDLLMLDNLHTLTQVNSIDTQLEMLKYPELLLDAWRKLAPSDQSMFAGDGRKLRQAVTIAVKPNTNIITITVIARDPHAAAAYANSIAATYFTRDQSSTQSLTRQAREVMAHRVAQARADYQHAMTTLADFQHRTGLVNPEVQFSKASENLATLQLEYAHTQTQISADRRLLTSLRSRLDHTAADVVSSTVISSNPQYALVMQRLEELNTERAQLAQEYTPQSSEVQEIDARIAGQQKRLQQISEMAVASETRGQNPIREEFDRQYAGTMAAIDANAVRLKALSGEINSYTTQLQRFPEDDKQLTEQMMEVHLLGDKVNKLAQEYQALLTSENASIPEGRVAEAANPQFAEIAPSRLAIWLFAVVMGVLFAVVGALFSEMVDPRVIDRAMAERIAGTMCVSNIPCLPIKGTPSIDTCMLDDSILERFLVLSNSLAENQQTQLLLVTSPGPGEGKSLCSQYLALTFAQYGKRVLLVDGNLRCPSLLVEHGQAPAEGLAQLSATPALCDTACISVDHAGVDVLPTGKVTTNPALVLGKLKSQGTLRQLAEKYDAVIIDGPSCAALSDVQVLASMADHVLLVVAEKQTTRQSLQEACRALRHIGTAVAGFVFNMSSSQQRL